MKALKPIFAKSNRGSISMTTKSPITGATEKALYALRNGPFPAQETNAGVQHKLLYQGYAEIEQLPSPYRTHKGRKIAYLKITEKGLRYLENGI